MTTAEVYPGQSDHARIGDRPRFDLAAREQGLQGPQGPPRDLADRDAAGVLPRGERWKLLRWQWEHSSLPRLHHCRLYSTGQLVAVCRGVGGSYVSGVQTCGSIWSCPVCSAVIRTRRAMAIEAAARGWVDGGEGRWLAFLTLTVRHSMRDRLADLYGALAAAWKVLRESRWWRRMRLDHVIRSAEVTFGMNGWHPHLHLLLFGHGAELAPEVADELSRRWREIVRGHGMDPTSLARGARLQAVTVDGAGAVGRYLSKVLDDDGRSWSVGSELARSDVKRSKRGVSPMELLYRASRGDALAARCWREYEQATFGRRCIEASRGLALSRVADEDLVREDQGGEVVLTIHADDYRRLAWAGWVPVLLDAAEAGHALEVFQAARRLTQLGAA